MKCPLYEQLHTFGKAPARRLFPVISDADDDGPGAHRTAAVLEPQRGRTAIDVLLRGSPRIGIARPVQQPAGAGMGASIVI